MKNEYESILDNLTDQEIKDLEFIIPIFISKEEVENLDYEKVLAEIEKIVPDRKSLLISHSRVEFVFRDYVRNQRDFAEIPEVRKWILESLKGLPWVYFNYKKTTDGFFGMYLHSYLIENGIKRIGEKMKVDMSSNYMKDYLFGLFANLNVFTEEFEIPEKLNRIISKEITDYFTNNGRVM